MVNQTDHWPGLLVSGTDTGVGKTRVTCWIATELARRGVKLGLCKPVASGADFVDDKPIWGDTESLHRVCPVPCTTSQITPNRFLEPLAPNVAARRDPAWQSRSLTMQDYLAAITSWEGKCESLVVEGVGGLLCPITDSQTMADLAIAWGRPVLLVARQGLGTINHTMMTLDIARQRGIEVIGVVLNRSEEGPLTLADETNFDELSRWTDTPLWGPTPFQAHIEPVPGAIRQVVDTILARWER
jgi:dethiobiotin synthetase